MPYGTYNRVIANAHPLFVIVSVFFFVFQNTSIVQASSDPNQLRIIATGLVKQGRKLEAAARLEEAGTERLRTHKPLFKIFGIEVDPLSLQPIADLSDAAELFYEGGEYERGIACYKKALAFAESKEMKEVAAKAHWRLGVGEDRLKMYRVAIAHYRIALVGFSELGMEEERARILVLMGKTLTDLGERKEGAKHLAAGKAAYMFLGKADAYAALQRDMGSSPHEARAIHTNLGKKLEAAARLEAAGEEGIRTHKPFIKIFGIIEIAGLPLQPIADLTGAAELFYEIREYERAIACYQKAIAFAESKEIKDAAAKAPSRLGDGIETAPLLGRMADIEGEIRRHDDALKHYSKALERYRAAGPENKAAETLYAMGNVEFSRAEYIAAIFKFREAAKIFKRLGLESGYARALYGEGRANHLLPNHDEASKKLKAAYTVFRKIDDRRSASVTLTELGRAYFDMKDYASAVKAFNESIELTEGLRDELSGAARRDFVAAEHMNYQFLSAAYIKTNDHSNAVKAVEFGKARYLAEELLAGGQSPTLSGDEIRASLGRDEAVVMYDNVHARFKVIAAITADGIATHLLYDPIFGDPRWYEYATDAAVELAPRRAVKIVEREKMPEPVKSINDGCNCDAIINYYRMLLTADPSKTRGAVVRMRGVKTREEEIREVSKILYRLFVKPVEGAIKGKRDIIIVPDGPLAFLPFETLINDDGRYMAELYNIRYVQSMGVMELLKRRNYDNARLPIAAFGSPVYNRGTYNLEMAGAGAQYAASRSLGEAGKDPFAASPYSFFDPVAAGNLPASLVEVNSVTSIFDGARVFTGEAATETKVKTLSASGELGRYKVIHFAAHAFILQAAPRLSAIVLTLPKDKTDTDDGFLNLDEIAGLKLKADFVNLSACETGLGKLYAGEGVVGFTHAFLVAGANALSVSLWQVSDDSTAIFMKGIYKEAANAGFSYSRAIGEMKRRFIRGDFGAAYAAPFYWAPFVYYGR